MKKMILISEKPRHACNILNGIKTREIRKSKPNIQLPCEVLVYVTKEQDIVRIKKISGDRFVCEKAFDLNDYENMCSGYTAKGKVVAKFTLTGFDEIDPWDSEMYTHDSCLTNEELLGYIGNKQGYAWHIENLVIFDRPMELSELMPVKWKHCGVKDKRGLYRCDKCPYGGDYNRGCRYKPLEKAPQSWCYVEVKEND